MIERWPMLAGTFMVGDASLPVRDPMPRIFRPAAPRAALDQGGAK
jgi:hypothetical protein